METVAVCNRYNSKKKFIPLVEDENKRHLIITIEDLNNNNKNGIPYSP